ncbi:beta-glucosyl transferase [Serratia phage SP1]|nr:beta-glucosyl transferase [Serratia phage SP1]
MKIALLNLANNVTGYKTTPSGETLYMASALRDMGYEVDVISNKPSDDVVSFEQVSDINAYDHLLVIGGAINFFGGKESPTIINNYKLMAQYKGTINYLLTDIRLPFNQLWPSIEHRGWGYEKDEVWISSPVNIISQGYDLETIRKVHSKVQAAITYRYFPLERYKIYGTGFKISEPAEKTSDLIYGGSFRGGAREEKMVNFLFDQITLSVEFYGNAKASQFKNKKFPWTEAPRFTGKIPMSDVQAKNDSGLTTLVIGDKLYNDNFITLRVWETMSSDAIMLIDEEFDSNHLIISDSRFYFRTKDELVEKIEAIKADPTLRWALKTNQHKRLKEVIADKAEWQKAFIAAIA